MLPFVYQMSGCAHASSSITPSISPCLLSAKHGPECLTLVTSNPQYESCKVSGFISLSNLQMRKLRLPSASFHMPGTMLTCIKL